MFQNKIHSKGHHLATIHYYPKPTAEGCGVFCFFSSCYLTSLNEIQETAFIKTALLE